MTAAEKNLEIIAQAVRLARAAPPGTRGKTILDQLVKDFPEVDLDEIKTNLAHAAVLLLRQHNG